MNQHDPILTKEQPINSKIVSKSISKRKNKETVFRFKRKNWFLFFKTWTSNRSWWTWSFRKKWRRWNQKTKRIRRTC